MEIKSQNVSTDAFLRSISEKQDRRKIYKKRKEACCEEAEGTEEEEGEFRTSYFINSQPIALAVRFLNATLTFFR